MTIKVNNAIVLRPWRKEDVKRLISLAINQHIADFLIDVFPHPYTLKDAEKWIAMCQGEKKNLLLAIEYNNELIGGIGGHFKEDIHRYNVELGYWIAENYWGKGIISKTLATFCDHLFSNYKINRIYADVFSTNPASGKVLEKNGFIQEGLLKKAAYKNGFFIDLLVYSKLK
jgi:RimJ/RimL family protein N-acetyltransferase